MTKASALPALYLETRDVHTADARLFGRKPRRSLDSWARALGLGPSVFLARVVPTPEAELFRCYKNCGEYSDVHPEWESLHGYSILPTNCGCSLFNFERHAIVRHRLSGDMFDITPDFEGLGHKLFLPDCVEGEVERKYDAEVRCDVNFHRGTVGTRDCNKCGAKVTFERKTCFSEARGPQIFEGALEDAIEEAKSSASTDNGEDDWLCGVVLQENAPNARRKKGSKNRKTRGGRC